MKRMTTHVKETRKTIATPCIFGVILLLLFRAGPCFASTAISVGDGWHSFLCAETVGASNSLGAFTFTTSTQTVLSVADWDYDYEQYNVYDNGQTLGPTSVPGQRGVSIDNPGSALASAQWSHGTFNLGAGSHAITIHIIQTGPGDVDGLAQGSLRVDLPASQFVPVPVQFSVSSNYSLAGGQDPVSIAVADLNHDGNLDIVTANNSTGNLSILLGDGKGGFTLKTNYPVGTVPQGVAVGDFDGDGIPYIVATRVYGDEFILLKGLGDGNFAPATYQNFNATDPGGAVLVGDFNNDHKLDIVAAVKPVGFTASMGAGNGSFSNAVPKWISCDCAIATGDFNHDGKLDIVVSYSSGKCVSVLLGNGDGTFGAATNFSLPVNTSTAVSGVMAVADLNHDGKLDVVVADEASTNSITVFLGNGDGSLTLKTNYNLGFGATTVAIGDLNGDGIPDLVVGAGSSVYVMLGNGDGTFGPRVNFPVANNVDSLAIADVNNDGQPDIVSANEYGTISVLLNQTFPPLQIAPAGNQVVLAWPTSAFGFQLWTTTNCAAMNSWSVIGSNPTVVGTQNFLTNAIGGSVRYYRLQK
jgi:hypothetical protein